MREVVDELRDGECELVPVDHVEIRERAFAYDATIRDPEGAGSVVRQPPYRVLHAERTALSYPVGEEIGGCAGVHRLADVRAGVGEPYEHFGLGEHLPDGIDALVQKRPREEQPAIRLEREIDEGFDR